MKTTMKTGIGTSGGRRSFVLMEVLLAMGLFAVVGVALTTALNEAGKLSTRGRVELHVMNGLQTALLEASKTAMIEEGTFRTEPDALGVVYETLIEEMEMFNMEDQQLADMWRIEVRAMWMDGVEEREEVAEVFRYGPLYEGGGR